MKVKEEEVVREISTEEYNKIMNDWKEKKRKKKETLTK